MIEIVTVAEVALEWWRAFGEGDVDTLWRLSSKPVRYMLARAIAADEINARAATGDRTTADELLISCQTSAVHGVHVGDWHHLEPLRARFFEPVDMGPLIHAMRLFPRTETNVEGCTQVTFFPPDTPAMPWIIDGNAGVVVGFARVLRGTDDASALAERVASDRLHLWSEQA